MQDALGMAIEKHSCYREDFEEALKSGEEPGYIHGKIMNVKTSKPVRS